MHQLRGLRALLPALIALLTGLAAAAPAEARHRCGHKRVCTPPADTTPPDTTIVSAPSGTVTEPSASFSFTSSEAGSSFDCRLDGGSWSACSSPKAYSGLAEGTHTFEVRAKDTAGNIDPTPDARSWTISTTTAASYRDTVLASSGLVSYWRLGEASGTTAADAKGVNPGGYLGGFALGAPSLLASDTANSAVNFNGSTGYARIPDSSSLDVGDRFSIEAWVSRESYDTGDAILGKEGQFILYVSAGDALVLRKYGVGTVAASTTTITDAQPHHVVATKDGGSVRLYIDGVDRTGSVSNQTFSNNANPAYIGSDGGSGAWFFDGRLDEVALYNAALSAATVSEHFMAASGGSPPPPDEVSPTPGTCSGGAATLTAPGAPTLTDAEAAGQVCRSPWEPRPENATANARVPTASELESWRSQSNYNGVNRGPYYMGLVTGNFKGTTDEILQWGAWKWGFDADVLRAQAVTESSWYQSAVGDGGVSYGILQLKSTVQKGTLPLSRDSTPFNVDYGLMTLRHCYDGYATWLGNGYAAGDIWGCLGYYFSGRWYDDDAYRYITSVKERLAAREWTQPGF